jgi:hypothetical protein
MTKLLSDCRRGVCIALFAGLGLAGAVMSPARGASDDSPPPPAAPAHGPLDPLSVVGSDQTAPADDLALGPVFESQAAGIAIRPPAGMKQYPVTDESHLAEWFDENRGWRLKLARAVLDTATPLTTDDQPGQKVPGMLERSVETLKRDLPGAKILRQDVTNIAGGDVPPQQDGAAPQQPKPNVGILSARYTAGAQRLLAQQALIQANEHLYYVLTLTTPGSNANDDQAPDDPGEKTAVAVFGKMLDNVRLLDRARVHQDQVNRLFRTRTFEANLLPAKLRAALVPEQWFRILQNGKDVGYTYICEQLAAGLPRPDEDAIKRAREGNLTPEERSRLIIPPLISPGDDILIGVRSRVILDGIRSDKTIGPIQTDSESWMFVTADRKHEDWSRLIVQHEATRKKDAFSEELGSSDQHLVGLREGASLTVTQNADAANLPPITQELPPFYLPEALGHLLPRLLPAKEVKGYAFASFVGEQRAVMMRYVDVGPEQEVDLGGRVYHVIPVSDRFGFDGTPTIHYLSAEPDANGQRRYLGSQNDQTHITVLASDPTTLQKVWSDANLTRPGGVQTPNPQAEEPPGSILPIPIQH